MSPLQLAELIVGAAVPSLLISLIAGFVARKHAARLGLVDLPGKRKVHQTPTPLGGGIAIWLGVIVPLALGGIWVWQYHDHDGLLEAVTAGGPALISDLWRLVSPHLAGLWTQLPPLAVLLGLGTVLMLLGLADDRRGVDWRWRLAAQAGVALVAVVGCGWRFRFLDAWPWLAAAVSFVWIVGLTNSFNMLDNMDGLSAGVAAIAGGMLAAVMLLVPDPQTHQPHLFVAGLLMVLVGSHLGFLFHNRPPARLFMGDAGSYFIGFMLATISLIATDAGQGLPRHAILAPLCIFAVPIYDMLTVIGIRLARGQSPFEGDKNHFSHRLVDLGLTKTQAVLTIYLLTATCGLAALLLHEVDEFGAALVLLVVACVLVVIGILETAARRMAARR